MKFIQLPMSKLTPIGLMAIAVVPLQSAAVTLECLRVLNAPLISPEGVPAKQPFALVARGDTDWIDALLPGAAKSLGMNTLYNNITTGQTGSWGSLVPYGSTPEYHFTTIGADDGIANIVSTGFLLTVAPWGTFNPDTCAVEGELL